MMMMMMMSQQLIALIAWKVLSYCNKNDESAWTSKGWIYYYNNYYY